MVIGPPPYLPPAVRKAWDRAEIDLEGPFAAAEFASKAPHVAVDGAIVDVQYDASTLLRIVEILDAFAIPALFASGGRPAAGGGFAFSADQDAINAIVRHLLVSEEKTMQ